MATPTYEPIQTQTLSSTAPTVTFSSISQGYTDIRAVVVTAVNTATFMRFNSDSSNNYSLTEMWAGTSPVGERATNISRMDLRNSSSTLGNNMATVDIMNYSNSVTNKTVLTAIRDGLNNRVYRQVQLWRNTAAITTITFLPDSGNFPIGSTFTLYGIANVGVGAKATGGTITSDDDYFYHTFLASGTFTPTQSLTADYLVVAGGASGGNNLGAGGGAGGFRVATNQSLSATGYTVTVGAGGARSGGALDGGTNGSSSSINSFAASGGGGGMGGGGNNFGGSNGGSGGGKNANSTGFFTGNSGGYTPAEGSNGGTGGSSNGAGGGGGGAGGVGGNGANGSGAGGNGGVGNSSYSSWGLATGTGQNVGGTYFYAGGGGGGTTGTTGGTGGNGGGAAGGPTFTVGGNATANTGGGGGGGGGSINDSGGAGGSGIVIVRYLK